MSAARRFAAGALAAACFTGAAAPRPARAQQAPAALPEAPPPPPPSRAERWYGWQFLPLDVPALGAMTAGGVGLARTNSKAGAWAFYMGFLVTNVSGPLVHGLHWGHGKDSEWKAPISFAMRGILPSAGLLLGWLIGDRAHCDPHKKCYDGMIAGTVAGSYAASILDVAALGWEQAPTKPAARGPALRAAPSLLPVSRGLVAGLSGTF